MRGSVDLPPVSLSHRKLLCTLWCLLDSKTSLCCLLSRLSSLSLRLLIIQRQPELRSSAAALLEKKKKKEEEEEKQQKREGRWRTSCCSRPGTSSQKIQDPAEQAVVTREEPEPSESSKNRAPWRSRSGASRCWSVSSRAASRPLRVFVKLGSPRRR
ncbi:hypothetical protein Q8A67_022095 [Cirrhinus molitorella]|uniref:Uncharacterized protein n=1 Tax=Cirrhinus molitorella TaxID=172907 RepID=A0AA88PF28_9TELE|nr:hypothetical protein Q8A67_022095 [Cirrhinus molitorella]